MNLPLPPPPLEGAAEAPAPVSAGTARRIFFGSPLATAATIALLVLVVGAVLGPIVWNRDPTAVDVGSALQSPSWSHPMGTDNNGRDIFARFLHGARLSLSIAPAVAIVGALFGGLLGVAAGMAGGLVDGAIGRVMDAILAFPSLLLAMAVTVGLGAGVMPAALGILLTAIPWYALLLRSDTMRIRNRPYIDAATALGATRARIVRRHVLPHIMPTLLVQVATVFGYTILTLAGLGFIGLGAQPPTAEWGSMITDGLQFALTGQWWIGFFPGFGVFLAVSAANILADQTTRVLDPRAAER